MFLNVKFEGGLADEHKLPAYEGTKSLEGLTRSIMIVANFLVEGRVRRKEFGKVPLTFNLVAQRPGSFESIYEVAYNTAVIGAPLVAGVALSVSGNLCTDLLKLVYRRVTGQAEGDLSPAMRNLDSERSGDISALADAVEPSVRLGHNVINHGVVNINLNVPAATPQNIVGFNRRTKEYMWQSVINNAVRLKLFSMGSFNANQGTGRLFDFEEGRSLQFELDTKVDRQTIDTLLESMASYTRRKRLGDNLQSAIDVKYTSVEALDGRTKKLRILAARPNIHDY